MKTNRDLVRLASWETIDSALAIDAMTLSTDKVRFMKGNRDIYDLAINSWLIGVRDYAPYTWTSVASYLSREGLVATVKYFTGAAKAFIDDPGSLAEFPMALCVWREVCSSHAHKSVIPHIEYQTALTPEGIFLFLCRYLKRLTPLYADKLESTAVDDFIANQRRQKRFCRTGYNTFIIDLCRAEIDEGIIQERCKAFSDIIMADIEITPGTCYNTILNNSLSDSKKLSTLSEKEQSLIDQYCYNTIDVMSRSVWSFILGHTAVLTTVPKTLTSARTIAPEECLRQAIAHRMFTIASRHTYSGIDLSDQSVNQIYAREGSITGEWCTIDLSHASDDVTWTLVQEIYLYFPDYLKYLGFVRPKHVIIDKQSVLPLQSFATMGNSYTFINESEIFWLITKAAVHFAQRCGCNCADTVIVYGDDIICANEAYPFVVAFLSKLGFKVNEDKSYSTGKFRESCGKDYLQGMDVSSPYFPRRPLNNLLAWERTRDGSVTTTAASLIMLQHRLFDVSLGAAQYIELYIRDKQPKLGSVPHGTQTTDLWTYDLIPYSHRIIPKGVWQVKHRDNPWILQGGSWRYRPIKRYLAKDTTSPEDWQRVPLQLRPVATVSNASHNEMLVYLQYLSQGPYYASDIDRALGISTSRRLIPSGKPVGDWRLEEI